MSLTVTVTVTTGAGAPRSAAGGTAAFDGRAVPGVELPELRTRESRSHRLEDGSVVARVYAGAVNFRDGDRWAAIGNSLVDAGAGRVRVRPHGRHNDLGHYDVRGRFVC